MIVEGSEATMGAISSLRKSEIWLDWLAPKLALDKSVTNRCLRRGNERDYLVNPEARKSKLAADLPGDSMPKAVKLLPRSAELVAMEVLCCVALPPRDRAIPLLHMHGSEAGRACLRKPSSGKNWGG
jgi:hypothetical protein